MTLHSTKALAIFTCFAFLCSMGSLSSARAESAEPPPAKPAPKAEEAAPPKHPAPPPPEYRPRDEDANEKLWHLRTERDNIRKGGPIAGVVLSTIFLAASFSMLSEGAQLLSEPDDPLLSDANCDFDDEWSCHQQGRALLIGGAIIMAGTTIGLAFSARNLRHRKQRIRALDKEIRDLEFERYRTSISYGAPQKPALLRF